MRATGTASLSLMHGRMRGLVSLYIVSRRNDSRSCCRPIWKSPHLEVACLKVWPQVRQLTNRAFLTPSFCCCCFIFISHSLLCPSQVGQMEGSGRSDTHSFRCSQRPRRLSRVRTNLTRLRLKITPSLFVDLAAGGCRLQFPAFTKGCAWRGAR